MDWAPFILGLAIVGLEAGNVFLYRAGFRLRSVGVEVGMLTAAFYHTDQTYRAANNRPVAIRVLGAGAVSFIAVA